MPWDGLIQAIPKVFYLLTMSILSIIDFFQAIMRKLAGLDCYYIGEGEDAVAQSGDIVYDFVVRIFSNDFPILSTVFWGLVILGFILLFLSTIIAIIRSEYTTEKADNGKGKIMFKAFKSVIFFAIVPIVSIMGIYLANVVLVAVDMATTHNTNNYSVLDTSKLQAVKVASYQFGKESVRETYVTYSMFGIDGTDGDSKDILQMNKVPLGTTTTTFSGVIFKAAAHNANRVRNTASQPYTQNPRDSKNFTQLLNTNNATNFDGLFTEENENYSKLAAKIDTAFADNVVLAASVQTNLKFDCTYLTDNNLKWNDPFGDGIKEKTIYKLDKFDVQLVWYYYDLWQFNFIIGIGAAVVCATIFINIIFGLMRRIIDVVGLFMIAPPLIGLMPLDNEKAYNSWRGSFIKKVLMAYGAIGGMNIILLILPELFTLRMFNIDLVDWIFQTLLVLVALLAVKDFIGIVSNLVGGDDANAVGEKVGKDVGDLAGKAVKIGASVVGVGAGAAMAGAKILGKGAKLANYGYRQARQGIGNKLVASGAAASGGTGTTRREKLGKALQTSRWGSAKQRAQMADQDMKEARELNFKRYKAIDANQTTAENNLLAQGIDIHNLKATDKKEYRRLMNEQLEKDFSANTAAQARVRYDFSQKQKSHVMSMGQLAAETDIGKAAQRRKDYKNAQNDLRTQKAAAKAVGNKLEASIIRAQQRRAWGNAAGNNLSGLGKQVVDVGKPVATAGVNVGKEIGGIYSSNSFTHGFMGKDNDTLADALYRMTGSSKKAADKAKVKAKEQAAEIAKLKQQQEMLLNALRQIEAERNK